LGRPLHPGRDLKWTEGGERIRYMALNETFLDRVRGVAVGAAVGDALGMPLEFGPIIPADRLVRTMTRGRLPAGSFTDDTEMALALAESLLAHDPLDAADLAQRFIAWLETNPPDVGIQTRTALGWMRDRGLAWEGAAQALEKSQPQNAGNGSVMRCWPVALARWDDRPRLLAESALQSRGTHPNRDCVQGAQLVNVMIAELLTGTTPGSAFDSALQSVDLDPEFRAMLSAAPQRERGALKNSGWVRHTLESAVWGLLAFSSFEETVVQVANLGNDADTAASVAGALAGAAYGLTAIPEEWKTALRGEWPVRSKHTWHVGDFIQLADQLVRRGE